MISKLNIVLIRNANSYDFGGGERFPIFLGDILKQLGHSVTVVSKNPKLLDYAKEKSIVTIRGWWWKNQNWSGLRVLLFPIYMIWQILLYFWYRNLFNKLKPDVVHIQSKDDFIAGTYAAKAAGARVIWTDHADLKHVWRNLRVPYKNPIGKWIFRAAKKADAITVVSESELNEVTHHILRTSVVSDKINIVYNGASDVYENYRDISLNKKLTFCVISRLVTDKGIGEAIKAFGLLQKDYPDSCLLFVGNGPQEEEFKKKAEGIPNISFAGYQSDPLSFIAKSHVVLQPTYHEGFSVALVEASMMKKPIIATGVGGNLEIVYDKKTGLLVPPKDVKALHEAMEKLAGDESLCKELGKAAREQYKKRFDFEEIVKHKFLPLYKGEDLENSHRSR